MTCKACKSEKGECQLPVDDGAVVLCWRCVHHVIEHQVAVEYAYAGSCGCPASSVYPTSERVS